MPRREAYEGGDDEDRGGRRQARRHYPPRGGRRKFGVQDEAEHQHRRQQIDGDGAKRADGEVAPPLQRGAAGRHEEDRQDDRKEDVQHGAPLILARHPEGHQLHLLRHALGDEGGGRRCARAPSRRTRAGAASRAGTPPRSGSRATGPAAGPSTPARPRARAAGSASPLPTPRPASPCARTPRAAARARAASPPRLALRSRSSNCRRCGSRFGGSAPEEAHPALCNTFVTPG